MIRKTVVEGIDQHNYDEASNVKIVKPSSVRWSDLARRAETVETFKELDHEKVIIRIASHLAMKNLGKKSTQGRVDVAHLSATDSE